MREVQPGEILTYYGHVNKGFEYPWLKFVVLSESDIFGSEKRKKKKKKLYQGQKINDFNDLKIGDYVVHETHGLGIYKGIEKVEVENIVKDYLKIEYRDGGNLYILATGLDVIQKYASADAAKKPKLNKLGGKEWEHTKTKVRSAVSAVARISWSCMRCASRVKAMPSEKTRYGSGSLRKCFLSRRRRIS